MGTNNQIPEGVIPRAVREIFHRISTLKNDYDFSVRVAFVELYQEKLYDLLSTKSKIKEDCMVDLREDPSKGVIIADLTEVSVETLETTMSQLEKGNFEILQFMLHKLHIQITNFRFDFRLYQESYGSYCNEQCFKSFSRNFHTFRRRNIER